MHKGDKVTLSTGESGTFVRFYGSKVQIRVGNKKITGTPAVKNHLGVGQRQLLDLLRDTPVIGYRDIAVALDWTQPRAVTTVRSLVKRGLLKKKLVDGHNEYEVV